MKVNLTLFESLKVCVSLYAVYIITLYFTLAGINGALAPIEWTTMHSKLFLVSQVVGYFFMLVGVFSLWYYYRSDDEL